MPGGMFFTTGHQSHLNCFAVGGILEAVNNKTHLLGLAARSASCGAYRLDAGALCSACLTSPLPTLYHNVSAWQNLARILYNLWPPTIQKGGTNVQKTSNHGNSRAGAHARA